MTKSAENRPFLFDTCPTHISWSFDDFGSLAPDFSKPTDFKYQFHPAVINQPNLQFSFKEEVELAVQSLLEKAKNKKLAVCASGGVDSEILIYEILKKTDQLELYFLDFWGLNSAVLKQFVQPLAKKLNLKLNIIRLEKKFFIFDYAPQVFKKYGCFFPTYIAMTYLFSQIPDSQFVVVAEGDLDKHGEAYKRLFAKSTFTEGLPFMINEVIYRLWAENNKKSGQYYFYNSTPGLILGMWNHPLFEKLDPPEFNTKKVLKFLYPEVPFRQKSTNWENDTNNQRNEVIQHLLHLRKESMQMPFWKKHMGCFAKVDSLYFK